MPLKMTPESLRQQHPWRESQDRFYTEIEDVIEDRVRHKAGEYIPKAPKEKDSDYKMRLRLARFKAETPTMITSAVGAVFAKEPRRDDSISRDFGELIEDVDGRKTRMAQFVEDRLFNAIATGFAFAIVDKRSPTDDIEETSHGFEAVVVSTTGTDQVVCVPYRASQLWNWSLSKTGEPHWIRVRQGRETRQPTPESDPQVVEVFLEYDRKSWRRLVIQKEATADGSTKDVVVVEAEGDHLLGIVPIAVLPTHEPNEPWRFLAPMRYAYHYDIEIFQDQADLKFDLHKHAHPHLMDFTTKEDGNDITIGPNSHSTHNPTHNERMEYLSFPADAADQLRESISDGVDAMRRLSGKDPLGGADEASALGASGEARKMAFSVGEKRFLIRYARGCSAFELRIYELAARWMSTTSMADPQDTMVDGMVIYPDDFTDESVEAMAETWLTVRSEIGSDTFDRLMAQKIAMQLVGDVDQEDRDAIADEIEKHIEERDEEGLEDDVPRGTIPPLDQALGQDEEQEADDAATGSPVGSRRDALARVGRSAAGGASK